MATLYSQDNLNKETEPTMLSYRLQQLLLASITDQALMHSTCWKIMLRVTK